MKEKECRIKAETVQALADITDRLMSTVAQEKDLFDGYVDALVRIGQLVNEGCYTCAMNMMIHTATIFSDAAGIIINELVIKDAFVMQSFLDYYHEYIEDAYVLGRMMNTDSEKEEEEKLDAVLDASFEAVRGFLESRVKDDEECKCDCDM